MGGVSLGPMVVARLGFDPFWTTPRPQVVLMLVAGICNLIGFLSLVNGLQRIPVAHANILSASQVAMAAVAGVLIFHETPNFWMALGICLTIGGIIRFDRPADGGGV